LKNPPPVWIARFKPHALPLLIVITSALLAYPMWTTTGVPAFDDLTHLNIPQRMLVAWTIRHGQLPLWNPFNFGGQPLLAAGQSGPLYLPNAVYLIWNSVIATKVSYLFHICFAAVGTYWLLWTLYRRRIGAVVAAVVFCTCGFLVGHQVHTQMFDAFTWLPWLTLSTLRLLRAPAALGIAQFALALAGEVYAGHPQITFYIGVYLLFYIILHVANHHTRQQLKSLLAITLAVLIGAFLSAPQWLPTLQLVSYSTRQAVDASFVLSGSMPLIGLMQWFIPFSAGGGYTGQPFQANAFAHVYQSHLYWELFNYVGLIAFVVAIAVCVCMFRRDEYVRSFSLLAILFTCFALGGNTELGSFMVHTPGFNLFRIPSRYIGLSDFSLAVLAGIGVNALTHTFTARTMRNRTALVALSLILLITLAAVFGVFSSAPRTTYLIPIAILLLVTGITRLRAPFFAHRIGLMLAILICADDVYTTHALAGFVLADTANYVKQTPAQAYILSHLAGPYPYVRVAALPGTSLSHDESAAYRIPTLDGYDSLEPTWYAAQVDLTWNAQTLFSQPRSQLDALDVQYVLTSSGTTMPQPIELPSAKQTWDHWFPALSSDDVGIEVNVASVLSATSPAPYGPLLSVTLETANRAVQTQISGTPDTSYVVQIPPDWPRHVPTHIILRSESWSVPYEVKQIQFMTASTTLRSPIPVGATFAPTAWKAVYQDAQETVWENPDKISAAWTMRHENAPLLAERQQATLVHVDMNDSTWQVPATSSPWFVLSQMYDPNWRASVDGRPAPVQPIDGVLTGVQLLSSGAHTVTLAYRPTPFYVGLGFAGLGTLAFAWCIRVHRRSRAAHKKRADGGSGRA